MPHFKLIFLVCFTSWCEILYKALSYFTTQLQVMLKGDQSNRVKVLGSSNFCKKYVKAWFNKLRQRQSIQFPTPFTGKIELTCLFSMYPILERDPGQYSGKNSCKFCKWGRLGLSQTITSPAFQPNTAFRSSFCFSVDSNSILPFLMEKWITQHPCPTGWYFTFKKMVSLSPFSDATNPSWVGGRVLLGPISSPL